MATDRCVNNMTIAVFGGTFDPVHFGHIEIATQLAEHLRIDSLRLMPCGVPVHRQQPIANANQRLEMLGMAIADRPQLAIERREVQQSEPSFSIDSLRRIRAEIGPEQTLFMCLGMDALEQLQHWHQWRQLLDYCHIVAVARPGAQRPTKPPLKRWIEQHQSQQPAADESRPCGHLFFCSVNLLDISSTEIRQRLKQRRSIDRLTPDAVIDYIHRHHLYE